MKPAPASVSESLQQAISLSFLRLSLAVVFPVAGIGPEPFLVALSLVGSILRIGVHLVALPLRFSGSLTPRSPAEPLISVSRTRRKITATMTARNRIHITHP